MNRALNLMERLLRALTSPEIPEGMARRIGKALQGSAFQDLKLRTLKD